MSNSEKIAYAKANMAGLLGLADNAFDRSENIFVESERMMFWISTFGNNAVIVGRDDVINWCVERFAHMSAQEILEANSTFRIDAHLRGLGYRLHSLDVRYLHLYPETAVEMPPGLEYKRMLGAEAVQFIKEHPLDAVFRENFDDLCECSPLYAAFDGDKAVCLVGGGGDDKGMWPIGRIDTLPGYRNRGIARYLTKRLANELEAEGKVAYYTAWATNLASARLALSVGFVPAWVGTYAERI